MAVCPDSSQLRHVLTEADPLAACHQPSLWTALCPELSCSDAAHAASYAADQQVAEETARRVLRDGFATLRADDAAWPIDIAALRRGVERLTAAGWPATFVLMYDEAWHLLAALSCFMREATGNAANMDALAWRVDARAGECGFSPHRDRQPDDCAASFRADGSACYATCWIALSEATPDSGCLYVIPRAHDPGYAAGDSDDPAAPDPLRAALPRKESFQHIRALPCAPGDAAIFTHRVIHWGSAGSPDAASPRISFSCGCSDAAFEAPYLIDASRPVPPLRARFALACAQMLVYQDRFLPARALLRLYHAAVKAADHLLEATYRRKALREFVAATHRLEQVSGEDERLQGDDAREGRAGAHAARHDDTQRQASDCATTDDDSLLDDALDAVLDAAADGETVSEDFSEEMPEQSSSAELTSGASASKPPGKRARCSGDGA